MHQPVGQMEIDPKQTTHLQPTQPTEMSFKLVRLLVRRVNEKLGMVQNTGADRLSPRAGQHLRLLGPVRRNHLLDHLRRFIELAGDPSCLDVLNRSRVELFGQPSLKCFKIIFDEGMPAPFPACLASHCLPQRRNSIGAAKPAPPNSGEDPHKAAGRLIHPATPSNGPTC